MTAEQELQLIIGQLQWQVVALKHDNQRLQERIDELEAAHDAKESE